MQKAIRKKRKGRAMGGMLIGVRKEIKVEKVIMREGIEGMLTVEVNLGDNK